MGGALPSVSSGSSTYLKRASPRPADAFPRVTTAPPRGGARLGISSGGGDARPPPSPQPSPNQVVSPGSGPASGERVPAALTSGRSRSPRRRRARPHYPHQEGEEKTVQWVNNPTLGEFCFAMIGRADIEGSKSDVAMNAWPPQASSRAPPRVCRHGISSAGSLGARPSPGREGSRLPLGRG